MKPTNPVYVGGPPLDAPDDDEDSPCTCGWACQRPYGCLQSKELEDPCDYPED